MKVTVNRIQCYRFFCVLLINDAKGFSSRHLLFLCVQPGDKEPFLLNLKTRIQAQEGPPQLKTSSSSHAFEMTEPPILLLLISVCPLCGRTLTRLIGKPSKIPAWRGKKIHQWLFTIEGLQVEALGWRDSGAVGVTTSH